MKPYYQDESVTIYHGDCRDILPEIELCDFAWTDPPYNVGKNYGIWDDSLSNEAYLLFCKEWIEELKRLSQGMAIYLPTKYALSYWQLLGQGFHQIILPWTPEGAIRSGFKIGRAHV